MAKILEAERFVDMKTGCSYRYVNSKTEYFREHSHDYYEIFIMLDGEAVHHINGESVYLSLFDTVFIRASDTHNYEKINDAPFSFLNLTFTRETLNSVFEYLSDGYPQRLLMNSRTAPTVRLTEDEYRMLERETEILRAIAPEDTKKRKTAMRILLIKLFSDVFSRYLPSENQIPEWLYHLVERMRSEKLFKDGIYKMSEISGKSREHVARSLKKYFGKSPSEFINELRLNYIANMLKNSNHKIVDIILESGFNTVSYATALFLEQYGVSMSEYRSNHQ